LRRSPFRPFKGAGPAVTALLGGEAHLLFANTGVFLGHIQSGKLRPLAVASMTRLALLRDVPTLNESGFPNFTSSTYYGLLAPARTAPPVIKKLHGELTKVIQAPESVARLAAVGAIPVANTPEQFADEIAKDVAKWGKIVRENGIRAD
jgi:tripartite-type tricarboxylate transporter receptor subunit TctC